MRPDRLSPETEEKIVVILDQGVAGKPLLAVTKINEALSVYVERKRHPEKRTAETKRDFEAIRDAANNLSESFSRVDDLDRQWLGISSSLIDEIDALYSRVDDLSQIAKDQGGKASNEALSGLVVRLGGIFKEATGKRPTHSTTDIYDPENDPPSARYTSQFDRLVFTVLSEADSQKGVSTIANLINHV